MRARVLIGLAALAAFSLALRADAHAAGYPRIGIYGQMDETGYPFVHPDTTVNDTTLGELARFDMVIIDITPIVPYKPGIATELRRRNPNIKLIGYFLVGDIWDANRPDSANNRPAIFNHMIRDMDGYLYNQSGGFYTPGRVNIAKKVNGRYVVAEAVADFFVDMIWASGSWDGLFLDILCEGFAWTSTAGEPLDYVRAGYSSLAEFDLNYGAAADTIGDRVRRRIGPNPILIGNCGQCTNYESFNGYMRENFPFQNGGTWYSNLYGDPGGYLIDDQRMRQPAVNWLQTVPTGVNTPHSADNNRRVRFGLGSATLGEGYSSFNTGDRHWEVQNYHAWWYDEYCVDLTTGAASLDMAHKGWLGEALGPAYQMIWVGTNPDAVTNPGFESDVTSGWSFYTAIGATRSQDPTTSAVGTSSLRVTIPTSAPTEYFVTVGSTGTIPVSAGGTFSATFWAKASAPRPIRLVAATNPGSVAFRDVTIDTTWRQYQVALVPGASANAGLAFYLAQAAGDVWLDDVHFQSGATTIYRRDFQNGAVLVNPYGQSLTVPLGREYRKILGTGNPFTNDGSTVTSATVNGSDALFLIGEDFMPPAAVRDLVPLNPPAAATRARPSDRR